MKKLFVKKATRLLASALSAILCLTWSPVGAVADEVDNGEISIVWDMDYSPENVLEQYEKILASDAAETGVVKYDDGIMPCDANPPKAYHNLAASDYYYDGSVKGRIYTLKYFNTNSAGEIYINGFATAYNINSFWQNMVIEIYDYSTNECLARFDIDDRNVITRRPEYSYFYYKFAIINLDPNKLYYIGFVNSIAPTGLEINGYISHGWRNYFDDFEEMIKGG